MAAPHLAELTQLEGRLLEETLPPEEKAAVELRMGTLLARLGEQERALINLTTARRAFERLADHRRAAQADGLIGTICAVKGEHERAFSFLERARQVAEREGDPDLAARVANQQADAAIHRGDLDGAVAAWELARGHFESYWDGAELSRIYAGLARVAVLRDDPAGADRLAAKAVEEAEAAGDPLWLGRALLCRAETHAKAGDPRAAKRAYRRAISLLQDHDLKRELAEAYLSYGLFVGAAGEAMPDAFTDPPAFWLAKAQELFRDLGGLRDLEQVREAFRRYGRRATDKVAEVEVLQLLQELKQNRLEVQRQTQRLADQALESFDQLQAHAPAQLHAEIDADRQEIARGEKALARTVDAMALAEERFLGALNAVILERENTRTLLDLCRSLSGERDYARLPQDIAKMAAQLTGADRALVLLVDEAGAREVRGAVRITAPGPDDALWTPAVDQVLGKSGAPALFAPRDESGRKDRVRLGRAMACPLRHGETVFGAIYCDKELCGGLFSERDLDLLAIFSAQVATILENGRVAEELRLAARTRAATLEAISDGVLSLAADGRVTSINAAAQRILGAGAARTAPLTLAALPDLAFLAGAIERGEELDGRVVRMAAGDYLVNARLIRGDAGEVLGLVATLTEMKRATSLAQRIVGSTARFTFGDLIGNAPVLRRRLTLAEAAARSDSSVLLTGESGTGKEILAQAIHNAGARAAGPFVGINCAAIPRELLESELFGYDAGAFTGAKKGGHPGKFELADGGTILLDEIGDMPLEMQAKLLRVLQEKRLQRLGGSKDIPFDTRVIATTNRDLAEEVERGRFRQDLFFRLRVIHIELPPLRERREDIPLLVDHFLSLFAARLGKRVCGVTSEVMEVLAEYPWPGNVRELEHVLEGEVNLAEPGQELLSEVPVMIESTYRRPRLPGLPAMMPDASATGLRSIAETERTLLLQALVAHRGSVPDVARALGVSRGTIYNKMKKFQIDPDAYRGD